MDLANLSLTIGGYEFNGAFLLALILGGVVVMLFANECFNKPTYDQDENDPATQFLPKYLATHQEYSIALLMYVTSLELSFLVLSLIGPKTFVEIGLLKNTSVSYEAFPLWVALVLTGLIPNLPVLKEIERKIRKIFHAKAFIPDGAKKTANALAGASFDFSLYKTPDVLNSGVFHCVDEADFDRSHTSLEYRWARTCALMYRLQRIERAAENAEDIDDQVFIVCRKEFEVLKIAFRALDGRIHNYKEGQSNNETVNDELDAELGAFLRRLYVFIGCAVRLSHQTPQEIDGALNRLGFKLRHSDEIRIDWNIFIVGLPMMALFVFVATLFAPDLFEGYPQVKYLPATSHDAFKCASSALLFHSAAAITAIRLRSRWLQDNRWISVWNGAPDGARPLDRYILVALAAATSGYFALVCYQLLIYPPSWQILVSALWWSPLAGLTGFFIAYYFDNKTANWMQRVTEPIVQAAVMGCVAYFIAQERLPAFKAAAAISGQHETDQAFLFFIAGIAALIGFSLGAYLPQQQRKREQIAYRDRVNRVTWEAQSVFNDTNEAQRWLETEQASLGGLKPVEVVRTEEGLNYVMDALAGLQTA
jgi:hypothetical protein